MRPMLILLIFTSVVFAQTTKNDGDWKKQLLTLENTPEAKFVIRVGDIDNLGFGWAEGFNPFSGKSTETHMFPWDVDPADAKGTDKIMVPSAFRLFGETPCGTDGYSTSYENPGKPDPITIPLTSIKGKEFFSASIIMFIDDFQAPAFCSKWRVWFNGVRFAELETILNNVLQSGPIGKVIYQPIPKDLLPLLKKDKLVISIDDSTTKAGDGYAIDFVKLLIDPLPYLFKGPLSIRVINEDGEPLAGCTVKVQGYPPVVSDADGYVTFESLNAGMVLVDFSMEGYLTQSAGLDVISGEPEIDLKQITMLKKSNVTAQWDGKPITEGDTLNLTNIQFASGSAELLKTSIVELDKIVEFLRANPRIDIELSGHTSSEGGGDVNKKLSLARVESCKAYLVKKEISPDRIYTVGYGPERPVAPNDTETNRAKNRRVEMRIVRIR